MNKKVIIVVVTAVLLLITIGIGSFVIMNNIDGEYATQNEEQEQHSNINTVNTNSDYYINQDMPSNSQSMDSTSSMGTSPSQSSPNSTTTTDISATPSQETSTSTVGQELQPVAIDVVSNGFVGASFPSYIASASDIPSALHNQDNWAYIVANGGDIISLLGGAERINVQIEETTVLSTTPQDTLYQIRYRFTAHHTEAMSEGDMMIDRPGVATALVRVNSQGKVIQYEESVEW